MNILSIETSGREASLATLIGELAGIRIVRDIRIAGQRHTARDMAPALRDLLDASCWKPQEIGLVAVSSGPGSFTGLRIGITTAKLFAYAVGADIVGIGTLRAIATQASQDFERDPVPGSAGVSGVCHDSPSHDAAMGGPLIHATIAAERGQIFVARYRSNRTGPVEAMDPVRIRDVASWIHALGPTDIVTGPALEKLAAVVPDRIRIADQTLWHPQATTIGKLGWTDYQLGRRSDLWNLVPEYHRRSAAEEKRGL